MTANQNVGPCVYINIYIDAYQPRNPNASAYYRYVEDHFEQLEAVRDDRYHYRFGFWRPHVKVIQPVSQARPPTSDF